MTPLTRLDYYALAIAPAFYARLFQAGTPDAAENVKRLLVTRQSIRDEARALADLFEPPTAPPPKEGSRHAEWDDRAGT